MQLFYTPKKFEKVDLDLNLWQFPNICYLAVKSISECLVLVSYYVMILVTEQCCDHQYCLSNFSVTHCHHLMLHYCDQHCYIMMIISYHQTLTMKFSFIRNIALTLLIVLLPQHGSEYHRRHRLPRKPPMQINRRPISIVPLKDSLKGFINYSKRPVNSRKKVKKHVHKPDTRKSNKKHILPTPTLPPQIDSRQLFLLPRPRPAGFPLSLPAAFLFPAIPALLG